MLICVLSQPAARSITMPDMSDLFVMAFIPVLILVAAYGVGFYVLYLFYKQLRGIRQALDKIADRDSA